MRIIHRNTTTYLFRIVLAVTVVLAVVACDSTGTTADDTTGGAHPFFIKSDASTGSGDALGAGDGVTGSSTGTTTFAVPADALDKLFYICSLHSTMAGEFTVVD